MADRQLIDELLRQIESQIRLGQWSVVETLCRQVLQIDSATANAWAGLGIASLATRKFADAEQAFARAVELNPQDAASWHHLSIALFELGRRPDAESCSRRAVAMDASQSAFWLHLGNILFQDERFAEAAAAYQQSLTLDPSDPTALNNLGSAEHIQNRPDEARAAFETSLRLDPAQAETRLKLALVLEREWSLCEAERQTSRVVNDEPGRAEAWALQGRIQLAQGRQSQAEQSLTQALKLMPNAAAHSRLLHCLQYASGVAAESLLAAHKQWAAVHAAQVTAVALPAMRKPSVDRPLRLGFISAEFGRNPIGYLALPLLEHLDKNECTVACYFDARVEDDLTKRFRAASDLWHVCHGQSDEALADRIVSDDIDVLVDLMGHLGNRLQVHARRPAPLQITWLGYVGTTGLTAIDLLLADRLHVRPGEEIHYVESVVRMPNGYACYGPPAGAPPVGPLPALATGSVTFGCFNNPSKYSARALDAFSQVLHRVPNSRLLLKYGGLHEAASQDHWRAEFAQRGIAPERILFEGWSPHAELLASYNRVDLALDTQPYSGGLTTCEALWMGVPTITYPGPTFAGRHSTSHLTNAGYEQFIARDPAEYVELAASWAGRLDELAAIRSAMREQVRRSPLCDAQKFAAAFLAVVRQAWRDKNAFAQAADLSNRALKTAQLGQFDEAVALLRRALAFSPQQVEIQYNLAIALSRQGELAEAESLVGQILKVQPTFAIAWWLYGVILNAQFRREEALAALARSIELRPNPQTESSLLLHRQYDDDVSPAGLLAAHKQWDAKYAAALLPATPPDLGRRVGDRPLRLGFVSADFGMHPVGFLSASAIEHLDRKKCSVVCYSDRLAEDALTSRFRTAADQWRTIVGLTDHEVAEQIKADEIDILFDLAGHTGARLLVFARKPAPIQVTWLGYVGTTGLAAMDFLLADRFHVPAGEEPYYSESVLRMPHGYACYSPPDDALDVAPLPSLGGSPFCFGCFNNPAKHSPRLFDAWAEILRRIPTSRLLLKHSGLDQPQLQQRIFDHFAQRGIDASRILLEGRSEHREFLAAYHRVDLALDTQPYSGGLTTCEAIWMGVPVVTYPGQTFAGRHSTSHLSNAGYEQFIARDLAEYIELAASWADRIDELAAIRGAMRQQVRASHLCNAVEFANDFLAMLRGLSIKT